VSESPSWADLDHALVAEELPDRSLRTYPALLSTEADAMAWARDGAPQGALVVADYQASPRGRGGLPWKVSAGRGLGFSLVLRPRIEPAREGWLYTVATAALADVLEEAHGARPRISWPDEVMVDGRREAAVGIHAEPDAHGIAWAVVTVLIIDAQPPRAPLLGRTVAGIERRLDQPTDEVLVDHEARCATLGTTVRAHLVPLGPAGTRIEGVAVACRSDGSLAIETGPGRRIAIPPRDLGRLEEA
jgi:BirA family transcriptional regulator, biotin operon repressor / biotin---[acetyl-CoA-carboxylase] ligase